MRSALFANLFGVLALFQSGRLMKVRALEAWNLGAGLGVIDSNPLSLWIPGLKGTDEVSATAAGPSQALQPFTGATTEGPGGYSL